MTHRMNATAVLGWMCCVVAAWATLPVHAQRVAKYGADFLAGGVGARALAMGGAHVALADGASAGYWNPAGMHQAQYPEAAYMHAERFAGIVSFDYAGLLYPVDATTTVGVNFFRSGVNDIKNTLNAWDALRGQPKANVESHITQFSAVDMALFFTYARGFDHGLTAGVTGKLVRRSIGDFADAWGYSVDVGIQWWGQRYRLGANLQDVTTMLQSWSVNASAFAIEGGSFEEVFGQALPEGETYLVLPVLRLGSGMVMHAGEMNEFVVGLDLDVAFDGQKASVWNMGRVSFHPRAGAEYSFRNALAVRAGIGRLTASEIYGWGVTPSVGAGFRLGGLTLDYGFGDFGGLTAELGYSHRISVTYRLVRPGFERPSSETE